jgi:transcriptional regulator with XRE-family HTH domain
MNCQDIERGVVPFYRAIMLEMERQRLARGLSMQETCDRAGVADYYWSKALHASTPTGRQAKWETLQDLLDALFPEGADVIIKPKVGMRLSAADLRCKIKFAAALTDSKSQRELMSELGKRGAAARLEKYRNMTPEERKAVADRARKTRRANRLLRAKASKPSANRHAERLAAKRARRKNQRLLAQAGKPSSALEPCVVPSVSAGASCTVGATGSPAE